MGKKMDALIKIRTDEGKEVILAISIIEVGNSTGYGTGQYVEVKVEGKRHGLYDHRYDEDYDFLKICFDFIRENYGSRMISLDIAAG